MGLQVQFFCEIVSGLYRPCGCVTEKQKVCAKNSKFKIQVEKFRKEKNLFVKQNRLWNQHCANKARFFVKSYGVCTDKWIQDKIRENLWKRRWKCQKKHFKNAVRKDWLDLQKPCCAALTRPLFLWNSYRICIGLSIFQYEKQISKFHEL